jgi:hypothetical protein
LFAKLLMRTLCIAWLSTTIAIRVVAASTGPEGAPRYGFSCFVRDSVKVGRPVRIMCSVYGGTPEFSTEDSAKITLKIPRGMEVLAGDTSRVCGVLGLSCGWVTTVRLSDATVQQIIGELEIARRDSVRERATLVLEIGPDSAMPVRSQIEQMVTYRGGRAYRYGGEYLVPTDSVGWSETVLVREGAKARVVKATDVKHSTGVNGGSDMTINVVVFVSESGKAIDVRPIGGVRDVELLTSVRSTILREWTFAPTRVRGKPVSDWLRVDVEIRR